MSFEDKEELISAALDWINKCYERRVIRATSGSTGIEALRNRMEASLPTNKATRDEWKVRLVFWSMAAIQDDLRKAQERRFERAAQVFKKDILAALHSCELHSLRNPTDLARELLTMIAGLSVVALHSRRFYTRKIILREIESMIERLGDEHIINPAPRIAI